MNKVMRILSVIIPALLAACFASSAWAVPPVSAAKSTATASPTTVIADGIATSTITVTVNRAKGSSAGSGITVTLTGTGSSTISPLSATTNNAGVATFTVKDTVVELVTYTATDTTDAVVITQKPTVNFVRAPPTVAKSFSPFTIAANGTSTLTITLTNPNTSSITGATFTDAYPANLVNAAAPALSNSCGGTATASAGGTSLALSGGMIPASGSCTVSVTVISATAGSYVNSTGAVTSTNAAAGTAASATLTVTAISASLSTVTASPTTVLADGVSTSTITVTLRDGAGLAVSSKTVTLTKDSGSSTVSAASGTSDVNGIVTFTVKDTVVETTTYTATDTTDAVVITQKPTVNFVTVPTVSKIFSPTTIAANGTTTLSIKLTNTGALAITTVAFTDNYPTNGGAGQLKNASTPSVTNSCGGTVTAAAGGTLLSLSGGTIPATGTCTVSVQVTVAVAGTYTNNTGIVTTSNAGFNGASVSATLTVIPVSAILSTVSALPTSVAANGTSTSTITVTLKDGAGTAVPGKTVSLSAATGSSVITAVSNSGGVATFTVTDTVAEAITYTATDTTDSITIIPTALVTFTRITAPTVAKSFSPATIADYGTTTLTITLNNPNAAAITGVAFTDTYPATGGLANTSTMVLGNTCGGTNPGTVVNGTKLTLSGGTIPASGSCSVSVQVTANNTTASTSLSIVNSTGAVTSSNATSGSAASAPLTDIGVDPAKSTVVAVPTSVPADNSTTSTITVTLLDGGGNPVSGDTVTLTQSGGSSTITATGATPGVSDVNGQATFTVRDGVAQSVTYTATDTTDSIVITQQPTVTFGTALSGVNPFNAFDKTTAAGTTTGGYIMTKISGAAFTLDVVALTSAPAVYTGFTGTVKVELVDSSSGACATYSTIQLLPNQTFVAGDNGRHNIASITEPNAWKNVRVRISYPVVSPTSVSCSNDNFAIRPNSFAILVQDANRTSAGTTNTLNNTSASGGTVHNAGQPFTVQATAVNAVAATTTNYTGTPSIVSPPSVCAGTACTITFGTFSIGTWTAAVAGVINSTTATYSEVGAFTLQLQDTGFASVDAAANFGAGDGTKADCTGQYVCSSVNVGRFVPDHFDTAVVATSGVPMPCPSGLTCPALYNGFVYSGQSFTANVIARNQSGATTSNYDSGIGLSKAVTLIAWDALGSTTTQNPPTATPGSISSGGTIASTSFSGGTTVFPGTPATPIYTFGTTPTNPTDIYIRAVDADSVTSLRVPANTSVEGGIKVVNGRIKVSNAYGSELSPLTLTATAQYYGSATTGWINSATDSVTNLTLAANYNVVKNGTTTGTAVASKSPASGLSAGQLTITLAKPTGGAGTATISPTAPSYLPVTSGTATFGVYKSNNSFIYRRESY